jgi:hypothetical protein
MADFDDDDFLVTAIDNAPTHANNDYWKWSPETRAEYKQWHAAKQRAQQQQQVQIPATVSEDEGEGGEATEAEEEVAEEAAEETVETPAAEDKPKKQASRWVQYQQIARAELIEETPGSKPKLVEVNKRARAMYIEDGWSK